ncbi:cytochrome c-type biogenesis protein CcmH [Limnochorda pilosa]|uniref:Cytochrome c-type biogenesis protein n=1 Tax=Limnochorda pilosa TaxID=1555112 RepID=A0A0K2SFZ4_LIMPI|nr:cytochrome c-type biogenesis protein CcmH [Limnochorda pilosa]BAS25957.1 hypothetical protein LIP_0100 [Limnochorda pilosa]
MALLALAGAAAWTYLSFTETASGGLRVGEPAPDPTLARFEGGTLRLSDLRGRPVLLRISSRGCSFCSNDFAPLDRIQQRYGDRLQVVALETQSPASAVEHALGGREPSYPVVVDPQGTAAAAWPLKGLPMLFVLDRTGRLHASAWGEVAAVELDRLVGDLLPPPPDPASPEFQERFRQVSTQIRCQECEGLSVWESNAASAWTSRAEIRQRLLEGWTPGEIVHWFEDRYGVWILMSPPARGGLAWVWIAPGLALLAGAALVAAYLRRPAPQEPARGAEAPGTGPELPPEIERRLREYL